MERIPFDRQAFNVRFDDLINQVHAAERITKPAVAELSTMLLVQIHFDGDIQPINRFLSVLTPMNCRTAVLFFQHFAGFQFSEKSGTFGKKDKALYEQKYNAWMKESEDEHFNLWTWAEREVKLEAKPFTLDKVTMFISGALKKADKAGIKHIEIIKAILAGGLSVEDLIETLQVLDIVDVQDVNPASNDVEKEVDIAA